MFRLRRGCLLLALLLAGCSDQAFDSAPPSASIERGRNAESVGFPPVPISNAAPSIRDEITVASWNIQVLGESKIDKHDVMEVIVDVIRRFDVIAIQELRAKDQTFSDRFLSQVNSDGSKYEVVVGPRLGRSNSKEQYLYLYDTNRIELLDQSVYTINDQSDLLHREPLVASFRVIGALSGTPWNFTLVNIHTDPDEVEEEIDVLDDVIRLVRDADSEDDVILLGDLNAAPQQLGDLAEIPNVMWTVTGTPTNTRGTRSYDNMLFSGTSTSEFTGVAGVLDLQGEYDLTQQEAIRVSDHLPIWAAFAPVERTARIAFGADDRR